MLRMSCYTRERLDCRRIGELLAMSPSTFIDPFSHLPGHRKSTLLAAVLCAFSDGKWGVSSTFHANPSTRMTSMKMTSSSHVYTGAKLAAATLHPWMSSTCLNVLSVKDSLSRRRIGFVGISKASSPLLSQSTALVATGSSRRLWTSPLQSQGTLKRTLKYSTGMCCQMHLRKSSLNTCVLPSASRVRRDTDILHSLLFLLSRRPRLSRMTPLQVLHQRILFPPQMRRRLLSPKRSFYLRHTCRLQRYPRLARTKTPRSTVSCYIPQLLRICGIDVIQSRQVQQLIRTTTTLKHIHLHP